MNKNETNLRDSMDSETNEAGKYSQNFKLIYSPRSTYSKELEMEEEFFNDLTLNFDPITIKIIKKHFKERLGSLNKYEFISILKNHLLSWHPEHPQREKVLIKLLRRLFSEIDLNDNGSMEWAEFTNYIIHNSNSSSNKGDNSSFKLRFYSEAKNTLDTRDLSENVGYSFYIEKLSMIGIVENDKSVIHFYDANSFRKLKCWIDLKEIQKDIDDLELRELDEKAEKKKQQEKEEKMKLHQLQMRNQKRFMPILDRMEQKNKLTFDQDSYIEEVNDEVVDSSFENENKLIIQDSQGNKKTNPTKESRIETQNLKKKKRNKSKNKSSVEKIQISNGVPVVSNRTTLGSGKTIPGMNKIKSKSHSNYSKDSLSIGATHKKIKRTNIVSNNTNKKLTILCSIFLQEFDVLLVSASNNRISAWKYLNGEFRNANTITEAFNIDKHFFLCSFLATSSPQYTMAWDALQKNLYSGQIDGKILKWDLTKSSPIGVLDYKKVTPNKDGGKSLNTLNTEDSASPKINKFELQLGTESLDKKNKKSKYIKRDSVSYIIIISKIQLLASSYYNGMIILWDTLLMDKRKSYDDHSTGVYCMTYDSTKNLLFSCGFDHDIYVYDPYIEFPVYKMSGHYGSINNVICNEKDSELISLDIYGNIKIWDTQLLVNFQTINLNESNDSNKICTNLKMVYLKKQKKIMVCGNKIQFFETDKSLNPDLADDQIIFACFYDKVAKSIISFCLRKIKMWNPFTGKIKKIYEDPMQNEITAFTIDRNMKRTFLGDNMGKIKNFNMKNGKFLKDLEHHDVEINMLLHSLTLNLVVSCSVDNVIKIHEDKELTESVMIKELRIIGFQVKAIALIDHLQRLAIGLSSGSIKFYDIEHFRYDSDLNSEPKSSSEEVTCLFPFNDVEIIFFALSNGICRFLVVPPSSFKFVIFKEFYNFSEKEPKNMVPITCVDFDYKNYRMFCGDLTGRIICYNLKPIFDLIEETKLPKEKNPLELKISKEFMEGMKNIEIEKIWSIEGHQESIKHLNYTDIEPNIIISTSNDLRVKVFSAKTGDYIDELKQISNKFNPVPIGIKYRGIDPITKTPYKETVWRRDLHKIGYQNIEDIEENNTAEYSNKITIFNAKEKLLQHVRNMNVGVDQSNKWNLMIDIALLQIEEDEDLREIYQIVKEKEFNILKTEMIMQQKSIYAESYKPLFINEMDDEQVKEFSKVLSQKLRHVKLAISKANMGQNKYTDFDNENNLNKSNNQSNIFTPSEINTHQNNQNHQNKSLLNTLNGSANQIKEKPEKKKRLKPISKQSVLAGYIQKPKKDMTPADYFESYKSEMDRQINDLKRPFQLLIRKTKIKPINLGRNSLLKTNSTEVSQQEIEQSSNRMIKD